MYTSLFSEITLNQMKLKNRIIMAPMATRFASFGGKVTERMIDYYEARAAGGASLITIEAAAVSAEGIGWPDNLMIDKEEAIPELKKLADAVHSHDAKISQEIFHAGRSAPSALIGQYPVAPSAVPTIKGGEPRALTIEEIHQLVSRFGEAALRAKQAGFDAVTLHMAHGYLIHQFLSPLSNKRNDQFGMSLEGRARFATDIIKEVRKKTGDSFPIICRLSAYEGSHMPGLDIEESKRIALLLENAGADMIDITAGGSETPYLVEQTMSMDEGCLVYLAEAIKEAVKIPVSVVGKITQPEMANEIIEKGKADIVVMGRALIADPELPNKAAAGKPEEIRPCIGCLQSCVGRLGRSLPINCVVNPAVGRERLFKNIKATKPKKILVIGAGIAGLTAACQINDLGHQVIIFEKADQPGGQMHLASTPQHKKSILRLMHYLFKQTQNREIEINLNTEVNAEMINDLNPDAVVVATGSVPASFPLPGADHLQQMTAWQALRNDALCGENILILGGGEVGLETAEHLINKGCKVKLVEMLPSAGQDMHPWERHFLLSRISTSDIEILTQSVVTKIEGKTVFIDRGGLVETLEPIDAIVFAVGSKPNKLEYLKEIQAPVFEIGDCVSPKRRLNEAVNDGYTVCLELQGI